MMLKLEHWIEAINSETQRAEQLLSKLTDDQLNLSPAAGKWSIGELVDHLVTTNSTYFDVLRLIGEGVYSNPSFLWLKFVPKILGKVIIKSITPETTRKTKTVPVFYPRSNKHSGQIIQDFKASQDVLISLVEKMTDLNLERIWIRSPASGLILYTVKDVLSLILNHEKRHLGQAEEIFAKFNA